MAMAHGDSSSGKSLLERLISRRALQVGGSAPCKTWVLGFFCGVCTVYLLGAALPPIQIPLIRSVYPPLRRAILWNSTLIHPDGATASDGLTVSQVEIETVSKSEHSNEASVMHLYNAWSISLNASSDEVLQSSGMPRPPHLDNCRHNFERTRRLDSYGDDGTFPPWILWKGSLGLELFNQNYSEKGEQMYFRTSAHSDRPYPPWIIGSDEENYPLTRQVQRDIWIHQHPPNCSDPSLRFLVADWERLPGFGIGAQLAGMSGLLAIAIKEKRILVTSYYNRADHSGCKGISRSSWSCYFFPETSADCRKRAFELMQSKDSWDNGIVEVKENYTSKQIWVGRIPRIWGEPWKYMQPTTDMNRRLITNHRKMDGRWWIAQAVRYLMRFQTEYMCRLLNVARHSAFGMQAAKLVLENVQNDLDPLEASVIGTESDIERLVWSAHKPYIPRPLLSMHVRMGDKACEMVVASFDKYMELAARLRRRFPSVKNIWLSTEMQEVINITKFYPEWNFYFTNVTRQDGNVTMAMYEASLGRETSTNYPLVNFIMATEADFFIGSLGSTWCYLIDGMRNTGGKVMSGYLSVNKDRFWAATTITLGDGNTADFWHSAWLQGNSPKDLAPNLFACSPRKNRNVCQALQDNAWICDLNLALVTHIHLQEFIVLWNHIQQCNLQPGVPDDITWNLIANGTYSTGSAYRAQFLGSTFCSFERLVWDACPPSQKCRTFAWLAMQNRLWTADRLATRGWPHDPICKLCRRNPESAAHLLFECRYFKRVWSGAAAWLGHEDLFSLNLSGETDVCSL